MPLTPEANLFQMLVADISSKLGVICDCDVLDELLSLDVVHAVDTGDTVTAVPVSPCCPLLYLLTLLLRTRRRGHGRSRRDRTPPGHRGSSARG
jgi:hypothetical protein